MSPTDMCQEHRRTNQEVLRSLHELHRMVRWQRSRSVVPRIPSSNHQTDAPQGPQVFRNNDQPRYFIAFSTHMGCYVLLLLVIISLRFYLTRLNKQRDRAGAKDERNVHAFEDLTDKENPNFRYVY